ncbi:hypothetical protein JW823_04210 [bacterium]|nr:hypothetical protein [candidate division CSSED10-310 bacterium]
MSRSLFCIFIMIFSLTAPGKAISNEFNWGGSLGLSTWFPDWSNEDTNFESSSSGLYGPSLFIHYRNFGLGLQYFTGQFDLLFPGTSDEITADRSDFDVILSYRIARLFQASVLYKSIQYDWQQTFDVESTLNGFGFGGGINHVFPVGILLYGYGFYMPGLDYEQRITHGARYSGDASGYWFEAGSGHVFSNPGILFKLGYRYQIIDIESQSSSWQETTKGFRFDVSYCF